VGVGARSTQTSQPDVLENMDMEGDPRNYEEVSFATIDPYEMGDEAEADASIPLPNVDDYRIQRLE
jgi:hypothetical protein